MSFIIDQTFNSCKGPNLTSQTFDNNSIFNKLKTVQFIKKELNDYLSKLYVEYTTQSIQSNLTDPSILCKIIFKNVGLKFYQFLATLTLNIQKRSMQVEVTAINSSFPYKIQSFHQRILACKIFSKNSSYNVLSKAVISIQNGCFKVIGPLFMANNQRFFQIFSNKAKQLCLIRFLKQAINFAMNFIKRLLVMCQNQFFLNKQEKNSENIFQKENKLNKLLKYINRSTVMPVFDISLASTKFATVQTISRVEQEQISIICKNICKDLSWFDSQRLFTQQFHRQLYKQADFRFSEIETQKIKLKLAFPKQNKPLNGSQNKYIFNIVQFNQRLPINFKKIASGGFGQIQIAQVQFWHLITMSGGKMKKMEQVCQTVNLKRTTNKKYLAFKSNNGKGYESRDRLQHQIKIINRFKGAQSPFFCQYFKVNNQKSPFNKFLIMEYIPYPNLGQYLKNNLQSISFMTKLHFCYLIAQIIRFLTFYDVVHLDIKPDNILIYKRLMIKLIDFGQSYCPQICDKNYHKPAFSMAYGSPQIFDGLQSKFSQKNDTYSLGVIMFQIFFKRLPYVFAKQKVALVYKARKYLQYLYYVPEQSPKYGENQVMKIVQNIILKCLNPDVQKRPHALWIALVLKQCLNYLINYQTGNFQTEMQFLMENQKQT